MQLGIRRKKSNKYILIAGLAIVVLMIIGFFVINNWQNSPTFVEINSANANNTANTNNQPAIIRTPLQKGEPDHLSIPDRQIEAPIIYVDEANEKVFQEALAKGVVHYPGTPQPGELGNPYIFGHSSDYAWKPGDYKKVLKPLVDIPIDTKVLVTNHQGELFIYKVKETKIVGPKDVSVLDQYNYEKTMLTLQTSWPVGTALKRFIAVCQLDETATYGPAITQ